MKRMQATALVSMCLLAIGTAFAGPTEDGEAFLNAKNYSEAEKSFNSALQQNPNDTKALEGLGSALVAEGKNDEAAAVYERLAAAYEKSAEQPAPDDQPAPQQPAEQSTDQPEQQPQSEQQAQPADETPQQQVPPLAAPQPGGNPLSGWWAKTEIFNGNLTCTYYCFVPQGYVYTGLPWAHGAKTFGEMQKFDAAHVGTYFLKDEELTLNFPGAEPEKHEFGGTLMDSCPMQVVGMFQEGQTLEGTYERSASSNFGGVHAVGGTTWKFHKDGTVDFDSYGGVEATEHTTGTGEAPADEAAVGGDMRKGTYKFAGGKLIITETNGKSETHTMWSVGDASPPWYVGIDEAVFHIQE